MHINQRIKQLEELVGSLQKEVAFLLKQIEESNPTDALAAENPTDDPQITDT